jgi:hypothetical protein
VVDLKSVKLPAWLGWPRRQGPAPPAGVKDGYVRDIPLTGDGFEVVAVNVTKLRADNVDLRKYTNRLETWQGRVEAGGGTWRVINDLDRLDRILG